MTANGSNIEFEGVVNARDLGGAELAGGGRVRRGVVLRSETPEMMTAADVDRAVDEFGIERTIDLRGAKAPAYPLGDGGRRAVIDFFALAGGADVIDDSHHGYLPSLLTRGGVAMGEVMELMVEVDGPCLIHCHTGKDRTGFVSAMLLALAGATDDAIVADYEGSIPIFETMIANLQAAGRGVPATAPHYARNPPSPVGIRALLADLRAGWESPRHYLVEQGVTSDLLDAVSARLC